jgi:hypothetical protein
MRNVAANICTDNLNIHFMFNDGFTKNRAVQEIMWKNMAQPDGQATGENITRHMRFACRITNARTETRTQNI